MKQSHVERSIFGSEFYAMKYFTEYVRGLPYKYDGKAIAGLSYNFGDNQSVFWNATCPDSMLKKKSNFIIYHFVHKESTRDEWRITYINSHLNLADLLRKPLHSG